MLVPRAFASDCDHLEPRKKIKQVSNPQRAFSICKIGTKVVVLVDETTTCNLRLATANTPSDSKDLFNAKGG